jgi:hypothetical protein
MIESGQTISLFQAIKEMRRLSSLGKVFSFAHSTYNQDTNTCNGIRHVAMASLRPAAKGDDLANADHKLFYFDETLREPRVCWQPLIMYFQDQQVIIH